jgi:hypothetical protein
MNPSNKTARIRAGATVVVSVALVVLAFLRGDYLLGFGYGVAWGVLATLACWLAIRIAFDEATTRRTRCRLLLLMLVPLGIFMAYPNLVSRDLGYMIESHAEERDTRRELQELFKSEPDFVGLSVHIDRLKTTWFRVKISGSVPSRADLDRLHERLVKECPVAHSSDLQWNVTLEDTRETVSDSDKRLFSAGHDDIKNLEWLGR